MNLGRRREREEPEVNITSLIDVVFLLLIFFMVTTTFNTLARLKVELPKASAQPTPEQSQRVEITIDAKGHFFVNSRALVNDRIETLKDALRQAIHGRSQVPLVIAADGRTPHQAVVTAMDAAAQLGIQRLTIATTHAPDGS